MKEQNKCPYCKEPIQENASFCLHCMKSLDQKAEILKPKKKTPLIITVLLGALLLVLVLCLVFFFVLKQKNKKATVKAEKTSSAVSVSEESQKSSGEVSEQKTNDSSESSVSQQKTSSKSGGTTSGIQKAASSSSASNTQKTSTPTQGTTTQKSSGGTVHTHTYAQKVTKSATCQNDGEKTFTCSCGANYTQKIPATGEHNYIAVTKTVHHNEVGHNGMVKTADAYTWYECPQCSEVFRSIDAYYYHFDNVHIPADPFISFIREDYVHGTVPEQYEERWIVDTPAYDETVITGYKCSVCGKIK